MKGRISGGLQRLAFRVSARFKYILFPLDLPSYAAALAAGDFIVGTEFDEPLGVPPGVFVGGQGFVGRKGDIKADFSSDKQFFGITGNQEPKLLLGELENLLKRLKDILDLERVEFFELQARYRLSQPMGALATISALGQQARIVENATKAFSQPMEMYSAQLTSRGGDPNSANYFEVWVQPIPALANKVLGIGVVMRKPDFESFEEQATSLESNLSRFTAMSPKQ